MLFDDLLNNPAKWMVESRDEHDIVLKIGRAHV